MSRARDIADLAGSADAGGLTGRNLIINGGMTVAQRSTSVSGLTGTGYKTVDRWNTAASGATYNQSQETVTLGDSVIGDFKNYLKHDVTTGNAEHGIVYRVEDVQSVLEGTVTLSFYAKGTNPNGGNLEMIASQRFGSGGSPSTEVAQAAQDFTLTTSWQRFEFQITVPSLSGKTLGTDNNSYYQIKLAQPSDDSSTNAWELNITGVQLELGETATDFDHSRSYGEELALCQRYFEIREWNGDTTRIGMGYCDSTTSMLVTIPYFVTKRVDEPIFSATGTSNIRGFTTGVARNISGGSIATHAGANKDNAVVYLTGFSGSVGDGQGGQMGFIGAGSLQFDAEL